MSARDHTHRMFAYCDPFRGVMVCATVADPRDPDPQQCLRTSGTLKVLLRISPVTVFLASLERAYS